jgi:hypothetical protein
MPTQGSAARKLERDIRVDSIRIDFSPDTDPDLSYLGEYTDRPKVIDLGAALSRGEVIQVHNGSDHRRYRYWNPCNSVASHRRELEKKGYSKGVAEEIARSYVRNDYDRMQAYDRGDWQMQGCVAKAKVSYSLPQGRRIEHFQSGGLWGIESDSDGSYLLEVAKEELFDLKNHLEVFGIPLEDFEQLAQQALGSI